MTDRLSLLGSGEPHLRAAITQTAWAAAYTKDTYLAAQYYRLIKRVGKNKALVAVAHGVLVISYHVLARRADYRELGGDYFDRQHRQTQHQRLVKKLEPMGLKVTVRGATEGGLSASQPHFHSSNHIM
jgi:hypothetical protein